MSPMSGQQRVAAVVLAAGASSRFGSTKQLAPFAGGTMLGAVIDTARRAGLDPVVAVAPTSLPLPDGVVRVSNDDPSAGLSRSLQLGLLAVPAGTPAVILLGDQPTVTAAHLVRLLGARGSRAIVATAAGGILAPPVLLEPAAFALAERVEGDRGLRDILRSGHQDVTEVEVIRHPPDVDEPSDLEALGEECPGCGARYAPHPTDTTHAYIGASPACWAAFGELLAREFQDRAYGRLHRHTVDVYTVQHPGADDRRQRQSVAVHLIGLCHWIEHGLDAQRVIAATQAMLKAGRPDWPWLAPPTEYEMTVRDVLTATSGEEHERLVRRWAETTWHAWSAHHDLVRRWAADARDYD
jgi:CTP:molybdopterin cytidylyltransferase MocA